MAEVINVLVIGAGSIGERHVRCFQRTGRANLLLCEINGALAKQVAQRYGLRGVFSDLDAALADPPQAAVICTPAQLHMPMALTLARAGVHLLIEKPLSTSLEGIDELKEIVRRRIWQLRWPTCIAQRVLAAMRKEILSGRFGKPVQLTYQGGQNFPHYRPAYREIYYRDRATGGAPSRTRSRTLSTLPNGSSDP